MIIRDRRSFVQVIDEETGEKFMFPNMDEAKAFIAKREEVVEEVEEEEFFDFNYGKDLKF